MLLVRYFPKRLKLKFQEILVTELQLATTLTAHYSISLSRKLTALIKQLLH